MLITILCMSCLTVQCNLTPNELRKYLSKVEGLLIIIRFTRPTSGSCCHLAWKLMGNKPFETKGSSLEMTTSGCSASPVGHSHSIGLPSSQYMTGLGLDKRARTMPHSRLSGWESEHRLSYRPMMLKSAHLCTKMMHTDAQMLDTWSLSSEMQEYFVAEVDNLSETNLMFLSKMF